MIEQHESQIAFLKEKHEYEIAQLRKQLSTTQNAVILDYPVLAMNTFEQERSLKSLWLSGPVHTHTQGYKICLGVYTLIAMAPAMDHTSLYIFTS